MSKPIYISILLLLLLSSSCKTISSYNSKQKVTTTSKNLGAITTHKNYLLDKNFNEVAQPKYSNPVRVSVTQVSFNKKSYNAFLEAEKIQPLKLKLKYNDSLKTKPTFLKIDIVDRIEVISALNDKYNQTVKDYIKNKTNSEIITNISIALNSKEQQALLEADEVFLEKAGVKSYALIAYNKNQQQQTTLFKNVVVFAYNSSHFCWKQDDKYQLQIIDISESKCSKGSFKNSNYAEKERDYLKF